MQPYQVRKAFELSQIFLRRLQRDLFTGTVSLQSEFALSDRECALGEHTDLSYKYIAPGNIWGRTWQKAWFRFSGQWQSAPEAGCVPLLRINVGSEALLCDDKGNALTGLTAYCWFANDFVRDRYFPAEDQVQPGKDFIFYAAASANKLAGLTVDYDPPRGTQHNGDYEASFLYAEQTWLRQDVQQLIYDLKCLISLAATLPENDYRRRSFARAFDEAELCYANDFKNASAARKILAPLLARPAYYDALKVTAVGHSHLDLAYMWPMRESIHKCARTFATQLDLIKRYPEYIFGASQPQLYLFAKQYFPDIYRRIKQAVADGRWELQGGMWVESDLNLPDGESLVRQFLYGKNFFMDEFGQDVRNLWLPDVFGMSAALPQIMKLAGCPSLVSIKLSGNDCNKFPYHTFRWRGIDGSEVLTHFPPEGFYSSFLQPETLCKAQDNYCESAETGEFLSLFGVGDGGGGAIEADIEAGKRLCDLEGAPQLRFGTAQSALDDLHNSWDKLPVWDGELYFERHRGTATSLAKFKKNNHDLEQLLPALEFLFVNLPISYPQSTFDQGWRLLLNNQFHDIIAGSSIDDTYEDAAKDHQTIRQSADALLEDLAAQLPAAPGHLTLVNSLNTAWRGLVTLPASFGKHTLQDPAGRDLPAAQSSDGSVKVLVEMPPLSFQSFTSGSVPQTAVSEETDAPVLENDLIRYTFSCDLQLVSAYDKIANFELCIDGNPGNALCLYYDYPNNYDAWDLERHYRDRAPETARNQSRKVTMTRSEAAVSLYAELTVGNSIIRQQISLLPGSRQLIFDTQADWHEERQMLRVKFPTELRSDSATYGIQFGSLRRNTHENTSFDLAQFEVSHHKYMDLSENGYGAALLNEAKYGGIVSGNTLELTLLRSAMFPSLHCEQGIQQIRYALLPHIGAFAGAKIAETAAAFNRAPLMLNDLKLDISNLFTLDNTNIQVSCCKKAERSDDVVLRMAERCGAHCRAKLNYDDGAFAGAKTCDLMEREIANLSDVNGCIELDFHPFEIKTIILQRRKQRD